jgi:hypothetical protein
VVIGTDCIGSYIINRTIILNSIGHFINFHEMAAILDYGKVCSAEFARTGFGLQNTLLSYTNKIDH